MTTMTTSGKPMTAYQAYAHSVIGGDHIKKDLPCQDHADCYTDENTAIIAVADGHGSPQYFRSQDGSKFAVETTLKAITDFIEAKGIPNAETSNHEIHSRLQQLTSHIIGAWQHQVETHENSHPLTGDSKFGELEDKYQKRYTNPQPNHIHQAYGTTLIASAITPNYWFGFQIGDGKCTALFEDGSWQEPIPWDKKCYLNVTTSICDDHAHNEFRYWFGYESEGGDTYQFSYGPDEAFESIKQPGKKPIAIFMGSDGVDDSFTAHENHNQLANLYRTVYVTHHKSDFQDLNAQIKSLAKRLATQGSHDDVSMAGILSNPNPKLVERFMLEEQLETSQKKLETLEKEATLKQKKYTEAQEQVEKIEREMDELKKDYQRGYQFLEVKIRSYIRHLRLEIGKCKNQRKKPTQGYKVKAWISGSDLIKVIPFASQSLKQPSQRILESHLEDARLKEKQVLAKLENIESKYNGLEINLPAHLHLVKTAFSELQKIQIEIEGLESAISTIENTMQSIQ